MPRTESGAAMASTNADAPGRALVDSVGHDPAPARRRDEVGLQAKPQARITLARTALPKWASNGQR